MRTRQCCRSLLGEIDMPNLPPHAARVIRAACAMVDRRPSVPEAWREICEAVAEYRRITNYVDGGHEGEERYEQKESNKSVKANATPNGGGDAELHISAHG